MAASDILLHIPGHVLGEIKKEDQHPVFEAYVIAHPGESKTHVVGFGSKILKWGDGVIKAIAEKIKPGTLVFNGHNADNSHENRPAIGKVVAVFQNAKKEIINIIHRFQKYLHLQADVASFESQPLNVPPGTELDGHEVQPQELGEFTGVALAHSATAKPAFEGAIRLAALQCLTKETTMPTTLQEVHEFIKQNKIHPLALFEPAELLKLDEIQAEIGKHKGNENLYFEKERLKNQVNDLKKENDKLKEDHEKAINAKDVEIVSYKGKQIFQDELSSRDKLTKEQKAYIEKHRDKLNLNPKEDVKTQITQFLDLTIKDFDEVKNIFLPENKTPGQEKNFNPAPTFDDEAAKHFPD